MELWPLFTYALVSGITPGPNNIMVMSQAMNKGLGTAVRFIEGVAAGFFLIMILSCFLNLSLGMVLPKARPVLEVLGAAYILYLAYKVARSRPPSESGQDGQDGADGRATAAGGFVLQFMNVKVLLCCLTAASAFILPQTQAWTNLTLLSLLVSSVTTLCLLAWALSGSIFQKFLRRRFRLFNLVMAALLAYSAIAIVYGKA